METEVIQDQVADLSSNQSSPEQDSEAGAEGAQQAAAAAGAPAEKSAMDKLREKSDAAAKEIAAKSVNVAAKKPSELAAEQAAAIKKFEANFKFKAAGKDMEVPEYLRSVIKDEETQKHLHSLLSKAHGIEMIQDKLKSTRERVGQVEQAYQSVMQPIAMGREAYQRGDMDSVFDILKMDPQKVLQWAYKKVQLSQMPPEQRAVHEQAASAQRRAWELENQQSQMSQQHLQTQSQQIEQMMELVLERPDIQALAQAYDSRENKKPGAFRELVAMMGDQEFSRTGKIIHPLKAAEMAAELLGEKFGAPAKAQTTPAPQAQSAAVTPEAPRKIVLPNAGGSKSAAPAKAKVKTLDDIRKLSKQISG